MSAGVGGPPRLGRALIRLRAPADRRAELDGDVVESWHARKTAGRAYRMPFWRDVWSIVRPQRPVNPRLSFFQGVSGMREDIRFAFRLLRRQPAFSGLIVITLALGIAASTAIFSICDRVLFKPLPYPDPQRIVSLPRVGFTFAGGHMGVSKTIQDLPVFDGVGLYASGGLNLGSGSQPARVRAAAVSDGFFRALRVPARMGRTFEPEESRDAAAVAVLSHGAWQTYFLSAPDIVGRTVRINSQPFVVVGVMPRGFAFPHDSEVWIPVGSDQQISGEAFAPSLLARLAPAASTSDAAAALAPLARAGVSMSVSPLQTELVGKVRPTLLFLGGIAGLLLLATCANVAGLLLSRVTVRARELAVRASLGATPARLARQLATECVMFTLAGTAAGFASAVWMIRAFAAAAPAFVPDVDLVSIDWRFFAVGVMVTVIVAMLFAAAPAAAVFRGQLRDNERGTRTATRRGGWFANGLLAGQVATALVLLAATTAAFTVVVRLTRVDTGFHNEHAATFELTLPDARYSGAGVTAFVERLEARLRAVPGVVRVGTTNRAPGSATTGAGMSITDADAAPPPADEPLAATLARSATRLVATPDYFQAIGIRVVAGRAFTVDDRAGTPRVAVINATVARQLWQDPANAVGRRLRVNLAPRNVTVLEVVGVVDDVRLRGVTSDPGRQLYLPLAQAPPFGLVAVAVDAGAGDPAALLPAVRAALKEIDPELPAQNVTLSRELLARYLAAERLTLWLSSGFALLGLTLCAIGLYGALSQLVAQRTREIGIRMALGANRGALRRHIVWQSLRIAILGVTVGVVASGVAARVIAHFVPALDPPTAAAIAVNAVVLLLVAALAAWAPARRASAVDPLHALRID
jgi:putative ABC transport system permease protein